VSEFGTLRDLFQRWIPDVMAAAEPVPRPAGAHPRVAALWEALGWASDFAEVVAHPDPVEGERQVREEIAQWAEVGEDGGALATGLPKTFRLVELSVEDGFAVTDEDDHTQADARVLIGTDSTPALVDEGLRYVDFVAYGLVRMALRSQVWVEVEDDPAPDGEVPLPGLVPALRAYPGPVWSLRVIPTPVRNEAFDARGWVTSVYAAGGVDDLVAFLSGYERPRVLGYGAPDRAQRDRLGAWLGVTTPSPVPPVPAATDVDVAQVRADAAALRDLLRRLKPEYAEQRQDVPLDVGVSPAIAAFWTEVGWLSPWFEFFVRPPGGLSTVDGTEQWLRTVKRRAGEGARQVVDFLEAIHPARRLVAYRSDSSLAVADAGTGGPDPALIWLDPYRDQPVTPAGESYLRFVADRIARVAVCSGPTRCDVDFAEPPAGMEPMPTLVPYLRCIGDGVYHVDPPDAKHRGLVGFRDRVALTELLSGKALTHLGLPEGDYVGVEYRSADPAAEALRAIPLDEVRWLYGWDPGSGERRIGVGRFGGLLAYVCTDAAGRPARFSVDPADRPAFVRWLRRYDLPFRIRQERWAYMHLGAHGIKGRPYIWNTYWG
jgi:hypothetical protein